MQVCRASQTEALELAISWERQRAAALGPTRDNERRPRLPN